MNTGCGLKMKNAHRTQFLRYLCKNIYELHKRPQHALKPPLKNCSWMHIPHEMSKAHLATRHASWQWLGRRRSGSRPIHPTYGVGNSPPSQRKRNSPWQSQRHTRLSIFSQEEGHKPVLFDRSADNIGQKNTVRPPAGRGQNSLPERFAPRTFPAFQAKNIAESSFSRCARNLRCTNVCFSGMKRNLRYTYI